MNARISGLGLLAAITLGLACGGDDGGSGPEPDDSAFSRTAGNEQQAAPDSPLAVNPTVRLLDLAGAPAEGEKVAWTVTSGGGQVSADTTITLADGTTSLAWTLGSVVGGQTLTATWPGHDSTEFHATATGSFTVAAGGNNVTDRYGSDQWVADGYAYSGTWGTRGAVGNAVKIWQLDGGGNPTLVDSIVETNLGTISDVEVSPDGKWLVFTTERGTQTGSRSGLFVYELTTPGHPVFRARQQVNAGLHTGTLSVIGGKLYAFTAKDPGNCALNIYDLSDAAAGNIGTASSTPIPDSYCIHDTFVRDGLAFVFAWDEGLYIFDVGNGSHGGSPQNPVQISHTRGFGGETHNGWWYWNPDGEKKYLFIGQEGPSSIPSSSSGDIHVVDVSNFAAPVQVGTYHLDGAGVHNFWVDEPRQILYAAYYNGGVVALDISGTLPANLASREIARIKPGGAGNTYVWGVMLYNSSLYATDMVSGFWQLNVP